MCHIVGGDDLLPGRLVQFADPVELQVQRIAQHLGDHLAQPGAPAGGREQQGLLALLALAHQALHVFGKAHVEHAIGLVDHQNLDILEDQTAGIEMLDQPARRADQHVWHLAQHRGLDLEVLATGDQTGLDEGELREAFDFLEGLLGQFAGRQQDQRAYIDPRLGIADQPVEHWQHERSRLATAGLGRHTQIAPFQRRRNRRHLHRGRLDEFEFGDGLEQAFVQGELVKQGSYLGGRKNEWHRLTRLPGKGAFCNHRHVFPRQQRLS